jgi:hypothetical protein
MNWMNDAAANIRIRADRHDQEDDNFAQGLSQCITKDGQTTVTANLPMSNYRHTGVGAAANRTDYARLDQAQDGKLAWVDGGGTADAITAAYAIAITALVDGQECFVRATAANATTTPTFSPSGLTARTIVKNGGQALVAGDIAGDGYELHLRYDLANTRWELLNPATVAQVTGIVPITNGGTGQTTQTAAFDALSPTTTKGDIIVDDGTNAIRVAVGATNNMRLLVDSAQASGVKWGFPTMITRQIFTTGSGTYTTPTGCQKIIVKMQGAGGGGGARTTNSGSVGGDTTFNSIVAAGGGGGIYGGDSAVSRGGLGGTGGAGSATLRIPGSGGFLLTGPSSPGGNSFLGFLQGCTTVPSGNAVAGQFGAGGGGGNSNSGSTYSGGGGGSGEYVEIEISSPSASYSYAVGTGGGGGAAGGITGGAGGDGWIIVEEYY